MKSRTTYAASSGVTSLICDTLGAGVIPLDNIDLFIIEVVVLTDFAIFICRLGCYLIPACDGELLDFSLSCVSYFAYFSPTFILVPNFRFYSLFRCIGSLTCLLFLLTVCEEL
jgi:hypothetical protein